MSDKMLITGVTGFVGSVLARSFLEQGYNVHVLTRTSSDFWRIKDIGNEIQFHQADLKDSEKLDKVISLIKPDEILHLATYGGYSSQKDSIEIIDSNFIGTVNLLSACRKTGFRTFINTGSSSEYGIKNEKMQEEDQLEPIGDYGVSKAAATLYCRSVAIEKGLSIATARLFSPYGPWDDSRRLITYVIVSLLRGQSPRLSTPHSVRDYIFVEDVAEFYKKLLAKPSVSGEIYNVGSGRQYTIGEIVELIVDIVGNQKIAPQWGTIEPQRQEPKSWVADISKSNKVLGWYPATDIREGLEQTVEWFRYNMNLYQ